MDGRAGQPWLWHVLAVDGCAAGHAGDRHAGRALAHLPAASDTRVRLQQVVAALAGIGRVLQPAEAAAHVSDMPDDAVRRPATLVARACAPAATPVASTGAHTIQPLLRAIGLGSASACMTEAASPRRGGSGSTVHEPPPGRDVMAPPPTLPPY